MKSNSDTAPSQNNHSDLELDPDDEPDSIGYDLFDILPKGLSSDLSALPFLRAFLEKFMRELNDELREHSLNKSAIGEKQEPTPCPPPANDILSQEAVVAREHLSSNAILRIHPDGQVISINNRDIPLTFRQRILIEIFLKQLRSKNFSFLTSRDLVDIIERDYSKAQWNSPDVGQVSKALCDLKDKIKKRTPSVVIEHNGKKGRASAHRLSIPPQNVVPGSNR